MACIHQRSVPRNILLVVWLVSVFSSALSESNLDFIQVNIDSSSTDFSNVSNVTPFFNVEKYTVSSYENYNEDGELDDDQARLANFVREYNFSQFLPDDFEEPSSRMHQIDIYNQFHHINDTIAVLERLSHYGAKLSTNKDLADTALYVSSILLDTMYEARLSAQCTADIVNVVDGIRNRQYWALKFPDSWASLHLTGVMSGHLGSYGEFDQCIRIKSPKLDNERHIYGRYCQLQLRSFSPPLDSYNQSYEDVLRRHPIAENLMRFALEQNFDNYLQGLDLAKFLLQAPVGVNHNIGHFGVCFPASCQTDDIEKLANQIVYPLLKIPIKVEDRLCDVHEDIRPSKLDQFQKVAIIVLTFMTCVVMFCTFIHLCLIVITKFSCKNTKITHDSRQNGHDHVGIIETKAGQPVDITMPESVHEDRSLTTKAVIAFSVIENTHNLFKFDNRHAVLDTIRFMLTFFIFAAQEFGLNVMFTPQMLRNHLHTAPIEMARSNWYWFIRVPGLWNDCFTFTLGVTLVLQQFGRLNRANGNFSYFIYVWKRWYRLSVALFGILMFIYLYPLTGNGPFWFANDQFFVAPCKRPSSLLATFLYYSNWNNVLIDYKIVHSIPICNFPTWYVSMSTQLYLIAPIFFLALYRFPKLGITLVMLTLSASPLFTALPRIITGYPSYVEVTKWRDLSNITKAITHYHMNPALYITALMIGLLTGYMIKCKPNAKLIGGRVMEITLWTTSFVASVLIFAWHNTFWGLNKVNSTESVMGWWIVSKFVLPIFIGITCYMCCTGRGGIVNRLLTIRAIQPLAKLSYGIYLMRSMTIFHRITSVRQPYEMYFFQTLQNCIFDYLYTAGLAYLLHMLFEAPSIRVMKLFESGQVRRTFQSTTKIKQPVPLDDEKSNGDAEFGQTKLG